METVATEAYEVATEATEAVTQIIEVVETHDYTAQISLILARCENIEYALQILAGFGLFAVVVCLCYFSYRFFRIFF